MSADSAKLGLALEWFVNVDHVPIFAALDQGRFEERGLEVHVLEPVDHEAGMELVAAGKLDLALTEPIHMPGARAAGLEIAAIGKYFETGFGLMVKDGLGLGDLRGRTVAAPLGTYAPTIVRAMAACEGVELSAEDVEFVDVSYYLTDALRRGKADAAFAVFENYEVIEARAAGLDVRLLRFTDHGVPSYGYLVFVASERALADDQQRGRLESFLDAVAEGVELTREDPDRALGGLLRFAPQLEGELTRKLYAATLGCYTSELSLDPREWEELAEFSNSHGLAEREVAAEEMIHPLGVAAS